MHSSSEETEDGFGNECNFVDKDGLGRVPVSLIEKAFDFASMMETSDGGKLWRLSAMQTPSQLGYRIGRGQCTYVYRAIHPSTRQMVAVKQIELKGFREDEIVQLMQEVDLVKKLSHPNIIKYEGIDRDENTVSIILEHAQNGSLKQLLEESGKLSERVVASFVIQVLEGLNYLHHNGIIHSNLKATNILITQSGDVKLSDFGISHNLNVIKHRGKRFPWMPNWSAPEVIRLMRASKESDIWSLGCTIIELLTGNQPYGDIIDPVSVMTLIVRNDMPHIPEGLSDPLGAFLKECFHKAPAQRPSVKELSQHEWLNWSLSKDPRPENGILSLHVANNDATHHLKASPSLALTDSQDVLEHTFVDATFSKPVSCRVCLNAVEKDAVLCSSCCTVAHSKCAARAPPGCDHRSKLDIKINQRPQYRLQRRK